MLLCFQWGDRYMAIDADTNPATKEKKPYIKDQFNASKINSKKIYNFWSISNFIKFFSIEFRAYSFSNPALDKMI